MSSESTTTSSSTAKGGGPYEYYFNKVLAKRLKYLNNVNFFIAFLVSISLMIPYGHFLWNLLLCLTIRGPLLFCALLSIKLARQFHSTVNFSPYKTLGTQILGSLFSRTFVLNLAFYVISSLIIGNVFISQSSLKGNYYQLSKVYQQRPLVNDEWVFYWFHVFYVAIIYSSQQLIFQRNRLKFEYGVSKTNPASLLGRRLPKLIGNSIILNTITILSSPVVYYFGRGIIYRICYVPLLIIGLDTKTPAFSLSLTSLMRVTYMSAHSILSWEFVNHVFNAYATIGCLDGKKPISTYSSNFVATLLSGLRNMDPKNQLSQLTAFQELAYIATTTDPMGAKLRSPIYNSHDSVGHFWPYLLQECTLVIQETCQRINYRTPSDLKALERSHFVGFGELNAFGISDDTIFGNSESYHKANMDHVSPILKLRKYDGDSERIVPHDNLKDLSQSKLLRHYYTYINETLVPYLRGLVDVSPVSKETRQFKDIIKKNYSDMFRLLSEWKHVLLSSNIGILIRTTLKRDTESRVVNPVNYGNAVIAVTNLVIRAIEEDKKQTVTNTHIARVLALLELPIRVCGNYTDALPASIYLTDRQKETNARKNHLIALLHDLTIKEFFEICVKYNYKLNDLLLSQRSFKLAKYVINVVIAQQQQAKSPGDTNPNLHI